MCSWACVFLVFVGVSRVAHVGVHVSATEWSVDVYIGEGHARSV